MPAERASDILSGSILVAWRCLLELRRNRRLVLFWVLFPTLMLLLFGFVYARGSGGAGASFTRTAPGILIGAAMFFSCLSGPVSLIVGEREKGTLRRLLLTPLTSRAYFLGIVWTHLVIALAQTALVYGITYAFGGSFRGSIALGLGIVGVSAVAYVGMGFFFGARFARRTEDATGAVAAVGVPLLVIGGTFFPVDILPPFLLWIAQFDPIYHMNVALKAVAQGGAGLDDIRANLLLLVLLAISAMSLGIRAYGRMLETEREG